MKKLMLGILIGFSLSLGVTAYADDIASLIGKKVDGSFPLIINNVRADKDVLVIDSTSYLPVRAASALFGYDVSFNADLMVVLTKKTDASPTPTPTATPTVSPTPTATPIRTPAPSASPEPIENKAEIIDKIKRDIIGANSQISVIQDEIKKKETVIKNVQNDPNQAAKLQTTKDELAKLKVILADYKKQLEQLNKKLKEQN